MILVTACNSSETVIAPGEEDRCAAAHVAVDSAAETASLKSPNPRKYRLESARDRLYSHDERDAPANIKGDFVQTVRALALPVSVGAVMFLVSTNGETLERHVKPVICSNATHASCGAGAGYG